MSSSAAVFCEHHVDYDSMSEHGSVMNSGSESDVEFCAGDSDAEGEGEREEEEEGPVDEDGLTDYLGRVFYAYN